MQLLSSSQRTTCPAQCNFPEPTRTERNSMPGSACGKSGSSPIFQQQKRQQSKINLPEEKTNSELRIAQRRNLHQRNFGYPHARHTSNEPEVPWQILQQPCVRYNKREIGLRNGGHNKKNFLDKIGSFSNNSIVCRRNCHIMIGLNKKCAPTASRKWGINETTVLNFPRMWRDVYQDGQEDCDGVEQLTV